MLLVVFLTPGIGKVLGRLFSGEAMFRNIYTAQGGPGLIAFASKFPGAIKAVEITPDKPIVVQKSAFLYNARKHIYKEHTE